VGVTQRPQVSFSRAVDVATLTPTASTPPAPTAASWRPPSCRRSDGTFAWLFFTSPMPGASRSPSRRRRSIRAADGGSFLDADGDGTAGGRCAAASPR
jgi:hypothetical protein